MSPLSKEVLDRSDWLWPYNLLVREEVQSIVSCAYCSDSILSGSIRFGVGLGVGVRGDILS